jgi:hypothetical protein
MKLSMTLAAAALAASFAAPAIAADSTLFAIDHFNQSADSSDDRISVGPNGPVLGTTVSSMGDTAIGAAVTHFNASLESAGDRVNDTVTVFSGGPDGRHLRSCAWQTTTTRKPHDTHMLAHKSIRAARTTPHTKDT